MNLDRQNYIGTVKRTVIKVGSNVLTADNGLNLYTVRAISRQICGLIDQVRVVAHMDQALDHIDAYGSNHTEAIVTSDKTRAQRFIRDVDASVVIANASTRFNDGGQLGLGAEIGISTTKLHAYGPMGLNELTTTKFTVIGEGQVRTG